ncbi:MAG: sporulation protein YqfD, partial [Clostridia bacterium]|nr:sporulation protein YqfD [Clostridia bacterium]
CDIIKNKEQWTLASGRVLPVGITTVRTLGYEMRPATRTATEAYDLAKAELEAVIVADGAGRTLLERTTEVQADANGITLICTVICEEDIARISEIDVTAPAVP